MDKEMDFSFEHPLKTKKKIEKWFKTSRYHLPSTLTSEITSSRFTLSNSPIRLTKTSSLDGNTATWSPASYLI
jgi:hypothetical protein